MGRAPIAHAFAVPGVRGDRGCAGAALRAGARARGETLALAALGRSNAQVGGAAVVGGSGLALAAALALAASPMSVAAFFPRAGAADVWTWDGDSFVDRAHGLRVGGDGTPAPSAREANVEPSPVPPHGRLAAALSVALAGPAFAMIMAHWLLSRRPGVARREARGWLRPGAMGCGVLRALRVWPPRWCCSRRRRRASYRRCGERRLRWDSSLWQCGAIVRPRDRPGRRLAREGFLGRRRRLVGSAGARRGGGSPGRRTSLGIKPDVARRPRRRRRRAARRGTSLDAVERAVLALEDDPVFNAGTGAVLNEDGLVELDAAVMAGAGFARARSARFRRSCTRSRSRARCSRTGVTCSTPGRARSGSPSSRGSCARRRRR